MKQMIKTLSTISLVLTTVMALAIADISPTPQLQQENLLDELDTSSKITENTRNSNPASDLSLTISHFTGHIPRAMRTCDKYPRVCRAKGSLGPDCCGKRCVDTWADRLNCGICGKRCGFWEMCCKGKCVNPRSDDDNCGGCGNRCKNGNSCGYGMCSYGN